MFASNHSEHFNKVYKRLASTRPTAVNLFYALDRMKKVFESITDYSKTYQTLLDEAVAIYNYEEHCSNKMAEHGFNIFTKKSNVLTHCNTGALATAGFGTAFAVIKKAFDEGYVITFTLMRQDHFAGIAFNILRTREKWNSIYCSNGFYGGSFNAAGQS